MAGAKTILLVCQVQWVSRKNWEHLMQALRDKGFDAIGLYTASPSIDPVKLFDLDRLEPAELEEVRKLCTEATK